MRCARNTSRSTRRPPSRLTALACAGVMLAATTATAHDPPKAPRDATAPARRDAGAAPTAPSAPTRETPPGDPTLPPAVRAALAETQDYRFDFAQPGFFALLAHIAAREQDLSRAPSATPLDDWAALLERPRDFRGRVVTVKGFVGRNKAWRFQEQPWDALGPVTQVELYHPDQPLALTVIMPRDPGPLPLDSRVEISGVFCMVRQYKPRANVVQQAGLLVAQGPRVVAQPPPRNTPASQLGIAIAGGCAGLVVVWVLLRRRLRIGPTRPADYQPEPAPESLADALEAWAADEPDLAAAPLRRKRAAER